MIRASQGTVNERSFLIIGVSKKKAKSMKDTSERAYTYF